MMQFIVGLTLGFIFGLVYPYAQKICKNYKKHKSAKKAILEEAFIIYSTQLFDSIYDSNIKLPEFPELLNASTNIIKISSEYNKSFKIVFKKGSPVLKILNKNILTNKNFLDILYFFKKNDAELTILSSDDSMLKLDNLNQ